MEYSVIIAAAGSGKRMNLGYNKILYKHENSTIIEKSIEPFLEDPECKKIIAVVSSSDLDYIKTLLFMPKIIVIEGGNTREESVYEGIKITETEYVLVHDAARCNIKKELIKRVTQSLKEGFVNVIPTIKSKDACLIDGKHNQDLNIKLIQTPQGFPTKILLKAMNLAKEENKLSSFKDDSSVVEKYLGFPATEVEGDFLNIKMTTIEDLKCII